MVKKPVLHLLMGLPGAGKSTLAQIIHNTTGAVVLSSDEVRKKIFTNPSFSQAEHDYLYATLDSALQNLLRDSISVVYDANLNRRLHREEKYHLAKKYNAHVILWWVTTKRSLAKERRIREQDVRLLPTNETSAHMFDRIASILEEPTHEERALKIDGTDIDTAAVSMLMDTKK